MEGDLPLAEPLHSPPEERREDLALALSRTVPLHLPARRRTRPLRLEGQNHHASPVSGLMTNPEHVAWSPRVLTPAEFGTRRVDRPHGSRQDFITAEDRGDHRSAEDEVRDALGDRMVLAPNEDSDFRGRRAFGRPFP